MSSVTLGQGLTAVSLLMVFRGTAQAKTQDEMVWTLALGVLGITIGLWLIYRRRNKL